MAGSEEFDYESFIQKFDDFQKNGDKSVIPSDYLKMYAIWTDFKAGNGIDSSSSVCHGFYIPENVESEFPLACFKFHEEPFSLRGYQCEYEDSEKFKEVCSSDVAFLHFYLEAKKREIEFLSFKDEKDVWMKIKTDLFSFLSQ